MDELNVEVNSGFLSDVEANAYFNEFETYEFNPLTFRFGKRNVTPLRRIAAFSDGGIIDYSFSGITVKSLPWTPLLLDLKKHVEATFKCSFNYCLLNFYPNGSAYICAHKDDEAVIVKDSPIVTVSLGTTRTMHFTRKGYSTKKYPLHHGSSLIMYPPTNEHWSHAIPKEKTSECRISVTFRQMRTDMNTSPPPLMEFNNNECPAANTPVHSTETPNIKSLSPNDESSKSPIAESSNGSFNSLDVNISPVSSSHMPDSDSSSDSVPFVWDDMFNAQPRDEFEWSLLTTSLSKRKRGDDDGVQDSDFCKKLCTIHELDLNYDVIKVHLADNLFLSCVQYNSELKVHVREFYIDDKGLLKPSKNGLVMSLETWYEIFLKFNDFCLKYSETSFVANNKIAVLSSNNNLVLKSLSKDSQTIILNENQFNTLKDHILEFTKTVHEYVLGEFLRKHIEKFLIVVEESAHTDEELLYILNEIIEKHLTQICRKRFKCIACISGSFSQYKHNCMTMSAREIYQTFPPQIFINLDCKQIVKEFKHQTNNVSKTFLNQLNFNVVYKTLFDSAFSL